ncbi:helix-turn-helix transcriptional regulator [Leifsonia sp. 2MCAF36]|uniref:helix-turn-helix transcriptional regulator n=1 Tax=Leifsonia sp. 2MCAF36 TaxID=3232988 RepID=UPI003F9BEFDA
MKLEHLLLGILLVKPRTGYDLTRYMDMEGVFMRPRTQMSQVYRSLTQMAERGWVSYEVSSRPGAHDAKIYRTTALGREVFMGWLNSTYHPAVDAVNYEFRARVFFSAFLGEEALIDLLTREIDGRKKQIAKYRYRDRTIDADPGSGFKVELATMVEDFEHELGAETMDRLVERLTELREMVRKRQRQLAEESTHVGALRA